MHCMTSEISTEFFLVFVFTIITPSTHGNFQKKFENVYTIIISNCFNMYFIFNNNNNSNNISKVAKF